MGARQVNSPEAARTPAPDASFTVAASIQPVRPGNRPRSALSLRAQGTIPPAGGAPDSRGRMSAQEKRHALRRAAGFQELIHIHRVGLEAMLPEGLLEANAPRVQDNVLADHDRIAREAEGFLFVHDDPDWKVRLDHPAGVFIERWGEVGESPLVERAETGIQVVEARVAQVEGKRAQPEEVRHGVVRTDIRPEMVAGEEVAPYREGVAFTLKVEVSGQRDDAVTMLGEPLVEVGLFLLALGKAEAAGNEGIADGQTGIRGKDKVREARARRELQDLCPGARDEHLPQRAPLLARARQHRRLVAVHPRVDLILHPEEIRGAHQDPGHRLARLPPLPAATMLRRIRGRGGATGSGPLTCSSKSPKKRPTSVTRPTV